jgi:hypothetical protein
MRVHLGGFVCDSGVLLVTDPCYAYEPPDVKDRLSTRIASAAPGSWSAWLERRDDPEQPGPPQIRGLWAVHASVQDPDALAWRVIERSLCFDSAQVGVFDADFYRLGPDARAGLTAAILGPVGAGVVSGGASSTYCHDPWRVVVAVAERDRQAVGVRTIWYSGQLRLRHWNYPIDGVEVELHLDGSGLAALLPGDRWVKHGLDSLFYGDPDEARVELQIPPSIWAEILAIIRTRGIVPWDEREP